MPGVWTRPKGQVQEKHFGLCTDVAKGSGSCKPTCQVYEQGQRVRLMKSTLACVWILPKGLAHVNKHARCMDVAKGSGS